jgi:hypothetical protein
MTDTEKLARTIAREMLAEPAARPVSATCLACGRAYVGSGRFCNDTCRQAFDSGFVCEVAANPFATRWRVIAGGNPGHLPAPMRPGPVGWNVTCPGCHRIFESLGLRFCSSECGRRGRERTSNTMTMGEVGMDVAAKAVCQECGASIPRWRNGRQVSKATRFCSPACQAKARRKARHGLV